MPRAVGPPLCISMQLSTYSIIYDTGLAASAARQMSCGIRRASIAEDSKSHPRRAQDRAKSAIELAARGVAGGQGVHAESAQGICYVTLGMHGCATSTPKGPKRMWDVVPLGDLGAPCFLSRTLGVGGSRPLQRHHQLYPHTGEERH